ncbi:DNA polymerase/3'-5' exonuclease PolX [Candidatus Woesearchaeota archaeon]|nr:DNA polymerase/3'-5' exonuclease PolX [Candidatus Woesearchaeota archaeon]
MKNTEVAKILYEIADILELQNVEFKPRAYRKAAQNIESLGQDIEEIDRKGKLLDIPGVGKSIAEKIHEYLSTGKVKELAHLRKETPIKVEELFSIEGLGPKRVKQLYESLKIKNVSELEKAARSGKIRKLKGFGEREEFNIIRAIEFSRSHQGRMLLGVAEPIAQGIVADLKKRFLDIISIIPAGSLRRGKETVGDVDILVTATKSKPIMDYFTTMPDVKTVLATGPKKSTILLTNGLQADLRIIEPQSWGAALMYFTGSKNHNIALRKLAISKKWKLSEYGLFDAKGKSLAGKTEEGVYRKLGIRYIEPELREDAGEIELAQSENLPDLVTIKDIIGDFHCHSTWSDGTASIGEMAKAAMDAGRKYIVMTDHTGVLKIAGGLEPKDFEKQWKEIDTLNRQSSKKGFTIFKGCEVNIMEDGKPDLPDATLKKMDVVVGSIHHGFKNPSTTMTRRIRMAMENPHIDIIGHLSGRIINKREPYAYDFDELLDVAKSTETVLEINSFPDRLDLKDSDVREAIKRGVTLSIDTDSHAVEHFLNIRYGLSTARRGWVTRNDIINWMSAEKVKDYFSK